MEFSAEGILCHTLSLALGTRNRANSLSNYFCPSSCACTWACFTTHSLSDTTACFYAGCVAAAVIHFFALHWLCQGQAHSSINPVLIQQGENLELYTYICVYIYIYMCKALETNHGNIEITVIVIL